MARLPRLCLPDMPQHIIQRGNNRQICFAGTEDFAAYAGWLGEYARKYEVAIHSWVFMTNHVHLLATPRTADGISSLMQSLGRQYVRYFNHTYQRTGTLWEGRFRSCVVDAEDYLLICQRYIELNPVRAGMVSQPEDYTWSSFRSNGLGHPASFWSPHEVYLRLGATQEERLGVYQSLFQAHVDPKKTDAIRSATNQNMALGNDRFKEEVARLTGRRTETQRRGRKPREMKL